MFKLSIKLLAIALLPALLVSGNPLKFARAAEPEIKKLDPKGVQFFETKIRPVLIDSCYECHSAKSSKVKGGLLLDTRQGVANGGDNGTVLIPGNIEKSTLLQALRHEKLKMPPKTRLPDHVIANFEEWVRLGAPDPRESAGTMSYKRLSLEEAKAFWSLVPLAKAEPAKVKDASWARSDIDRFVQARREAKGLKPQADADRQVLARRLYFDLIGLPPTPEEVDAFVKDSSPQAVEKVVDRLLQSPQFGERWGRHWLDLARYAESNGNADNTPFPNAWRYRNYVIAAVNKDKPYNRFITEQIAGDLLPAESPQERDDNLTATGLLALTSKPRAQNNPDYRMDLIADQIDVTSRAVLGLSVMCARCHDHKFDPISTKEYYGLAGIFESTTMLAGGGGKANMAQPGSAGMHTLSNGGAAMGAREDKLIDAQVRIRGDSVNKGETVPRGFLAIASADQQPPGINRSQSGRLELAQWLTRPDNPLTARVAVNRIWQHLFGLGLVKSSDNFGALGEKPSHPELLNYLAAKFIQDGWSTKKLIRAVVLSRTYQLSSAHSEANYKIDPDNVLLWRMNSRRLEAEPIRDAILSVSGQLDLKPLEGTLAPTAGGKNVVRNAGAARESNYRSVYLGIIRGAPLPELLAMFDVASPNLVVSQREVTTVPAQSLYLMNSAWIVEQSKFFAKRLGGPDDAARVDQAYRLALSRPASDREKVTALTYIQAAGGGEKALAGFCQALLASAEFRYLQ